MFEPHKNLCQLRACKSKLCENTAAAECERATLVYGSCDNEKKMERSWDGATRD